MMATSIESSHASKIQTPILEADSGTTESELAQAKKELEILKAADPFNVVEMAIEVAIERTRTLEALKARDAVVQRLVDAHESLRQKSAALELLQQKSRAASPFLADSAPTIERIEMARMKDEIARLERTIVELRIEIRLLKENAVNLMKATEAPPRYDEASLKNNTPPHQSLLDFSRPLTRPTEFPSLSQTSQTPNAQISADTNAITCSDYRVPAQIPVSDEPADIVTVRNAILANLVLPEEVPDDTLSPLSIPAPLTLQEFISNLSGSLRTSLAHYRLFYAATTQWCPEREEHGYFYTPVFKCNTNPRVAAAHRWTAVDVISRMNKPTECFFNKDGIWYYAGVYKAFLLPDLTTKEWAELPIETTQAIVKETIAGRKNTSPQNVYEISQLYAAGALRAACVGLQCVGFNNTMYKALLEQARLFAQSKWAASTGVAAAIVSVSGASAGSVATAGASASTKGSPAPVPAAVPGAGGLGSGSAWNMAAGVRAVTGIRTGDAAGAGGSWRNGSSSRRRYVWVGIDELGAPKPERAQEHERECACADRGGEEEVKCAQGMMLALVLFWLVFSHCIHGRLDSDSLLLVAATPLD
ncbi:hypothetical protein D9615_002059 [Tricholomella constricta]|uniref:DUF6697 domain-containing protein n=1 Tax=Tricholomella constricta TaxID=117010 RepID=A0A8H5HNT6_9AGAR|nr:hypothetical protein D9615_002059 [Tricholomella constricta]